MNILKALPRVVAAAILLCAAIPSGASTLYGPKTYILQAGAPQTYVETIDVDESQRCGGKAAFVLVVQNGNGVGAVSSATLSLNGSAILRESDFKPSSGTVAIPVQLRSSNTLNLTLKGGTPGGGLAISIARQIEEDVVTPQNDVLSGKQQSFASRIDINDPLSHFVLVLTSGDEAGGHRPKSFSASVNGAIVATDKDFVGTASTIRTGVTLQAVNTIALSVAGTPGDVVTVSVRRLLDDNACGPRVFIDTPAANGTVASPQLVVTGHVVAPSSDFGVSINGHAALVDVAHSGTSADPFLWVIALEDVASGSVDLHAAVTDGHGAKGEASRSVTFTPAPELCSLQVDVDHGLVPFVASFTVRTSDSAPEVRSYDIDFDGDGQFEITGATSLPDPLTFTYSRPGIYPVRFRVTDVNGTVQTATSYLSVTQPSQIDAVVRARWEQLRDAMAAKDVEAALRRFTTAAREKYREPLTTLVSQLPAIAVGMNLRGAISIDADYVDYLVTRVENGSIAGHHLTMVRDLNGVWMVADF